VMRFSLSASSRLRQAYGYLAGGMGQSFRIGSQPLPDTAGAGVQIVRLQSQYQCLRGAVSRPPHLSVVIPVHIREEPGRFLAAIQTLLENKDVPATEVLIVLNGKVSTQDILNSPLYRLASDIGLRVLVLSYWDDDRYRNLERPQNIFVAKQLGFEKAEGSIVVAADADCLFSPFWIAAYADYFDTHPDSLAAYGPVQLFGVGTLLGGALAWISTAVKAFKILLDFPPFAGHNHAFRNTVCTRIPGLYGRIVVDCQELPPLLRKELAPREAVTRIVSCVPHAIIATYFSAGKIKTLRGAFEWFMENARRNIGNYGRSH
jgi:hypothetical protein